MLFSYIGSDFQELVQAPIHGRTKPNTGDSVHSRRRSFRGSGHGGGGTGSTAFEVSRIPFSSRVNQKLSVFTVENGRCGRTHFFDQFSYYTRTNEIYHSISFSRCKAGSSEVPSNFAGTAHIAVEQPLVFCGRCKRKTIQQRDQQLLQKSYPRYHHLHIPWTYSQRC